MNPFGIFHVIAGALDVIGSVFGRKPRQRTQGERITFGVLYVLFLLGGIAALILVIRAPYFRP